MIFGNINWRTSLQGVTESYYMVQNRTIERGRTFTDYEITGGDKIVILGPTVADELFPGQDPLGQIIRISRVPFEVPDRARLPSGHVLLDQVRIEFARS